MGAWQVEGVKRIEDVRYVARELVEAAAPHILEHLDKPPRAVFDIVHSGLLIAEGVVVVRGSFMG
jgi:hypothetical protein